MRSNPVAAIWLLALVAAVVAYAFGATYTLAAAWAFLAELEEGVDQLLLHLSDRAANIIPALAIGAFVAFVPLAIMAIRTGQRGRMALFCVSTAFLWLAGRHATRIEWLQALMLAGIGATVMTARLRNRAGVSLRTRG